jgi:peptide deformylase
VIRRIVHYGDPVLRQKARAVPEVTPEIRELIRDMIETMHAAPGVGLAAPQVGESLQVIVYDVGEGPGALINPKIIRKSGSQTGPEGCLSIPGLQGDVERPDRVVVRGLDADGNEVRVSGEGFLARCLCHEIDHLEGILFIDRADPTSLQWVTATEEDEEDEDAEEIEDEVIEAQPRRRTRILRRR